MIDAKIEEQIKKYGKKCRTCQHWVAPLKIGRNKIRGWYDNALEQYDYTTGKCIKYSIRKYSEPEDVYENGTSSSDDKTCTSWEINAFLKNEYEQYQKECLEKIAKEQKEKEEKERKFKEEEGILLKAAEQGDSEAQFKLGDFYFLHNREVNSSIWFNKAADQGHAGAIARLDRIKYEKARSKRNIIIRSIIGCIIGGILGFIVSYIIIYQRQGNIVSIILSTILGLASGFFIIKITGMNDDIFMSIFIDTILGAIFFGIIFAIIFAIFLGAFFSGLFNGALFGAIGGIVIGVSCIKFRH